MKFINILILVISIARLIYFVFDHLKYSNTNVYYQKRERLNELQDEIISIELHNNEMEVLINNINFDTDFDDSLTDKLIKYRDDVDKLKTLNFEYRKIDSYLKIAGKHISFVKDLLGM